MANQCATSTTTTRPIRARVAWASLTSFAVLGCVQADPINLGLEKGRFETATMGSPLAPHRR